MQNTKYMKYKIPNWLKIFSPVCDEGPGICAHLMTMISILLIMATLPFSLLMAVKVVQVNHHHHHNHHRYHHPETFITILVFSIVICNMSSTSQFLWQIMNRVYDKHRTLDRHNGNVQHNKWLAKFFVGNISSRRDIFGIFLDNTQQ